MNSDSVFLISLGLRSFGDKVGINQIVWDPATNTLHVESDELLEQHTRYAVVVTNRVRDADGKPLKQAQAPACATMTTTAIGKSTRRHGVQVVAASIFTTQSVTSTLEKVQAQIDAGTPGAGELQPRRAPASAPCSRSRSLRRRWCSTGRRHDRRTR